MTPLYPYWLVLAIASMSCLLGCWIGSYTQARSFRKHIDRINRRAADTIAQQRLYWRSQGVRDAAEVKAKAMRIREGQE